MQPVARDDDRVAGFEPQRLLEAADDRWRILIMTAILTGLRQGELLGLQWGDVDWVAQQMLVRRTYTHGRFYDPKTKTSRRRVDLPTPLVIDLKKWKLRCPKGELDLVFPNGAGNPESHSNLTQRGFHPALRRAGLRRIRFHDLRHTYASLLIETCEHPKYIQAQMGHSSIKVTMDIYGHLMRATNSRAAEKLGRLALSATKNGSKMVANQKRKQRDDRNLLISGGPCRNRTCDHLIKSQVLLHIEKISTRLKHVAVTT